MHRFKNSGFLRVIIFAMMIVGVVSIVKLQLEYNSLQVRRDALLAEIQNTGERMEMLQSSLDMPFNDEYIIKIAREKLNLRLPEEIVYYNNLIP
ncbi:MAG: septum formation initiator family protein [Clostridia bacterium]|nr:septum formation initiator family protein [Clostridia bacterium]MBQ5886259.1 septum formation initiator family protein [Clostridia bacterium]